MRGTVFDPVRDAPAFALQDHRGNPVSLDTYDGDVIALTFLYTYCPDLCPAVTSRLRDVQRLLGDESARVNFVAVSVDPERDTPERAREYLEQWSLDDRWAFLTGGEAELSSVWRAYFIDPTQIEWNRADPTSSLPTVTPRRGVDALRRAIAARYEVVHSAPVYLIDADRRLRALFTPPLDPEDVAHDIRLLLDE